MCCQSRYGNDGVYNIYRFGQLEKFWLITQANSFQGEAVKAWSQPGLQSLTQNILSRVITADEDLKFPLASVTSLPIRPAFPLLTLLRLSRWLQGICAVVLNGVSIPFECRLGRGAAIMLNTCSRVPLQKRTTTIILISALFGALQQSSGLSSEDTWASLIHHKDDPAHIVAIAWCSPLWFGQWQQCKHLDFKSRSSLSSIRLRDWSHPHRVKAK